MSIILLDQDTINKIAAGEVIERPMAVVKELVENSIDAGANMITVEIKDGGKSFMRITDNGSGIERDDIELAFTPHHNIILHITDCYLHFTFASLYYFIINANFYISKFCFIK